MASATQGHPLSPCPGSGSRILSHQGCPDGAAVSPTRAVGPALTSSGDPKTPQPEQRGQGPGSPQLAALPQTRHQTGSSGKRPPVWRVTHGQALGR